MCPHFSVLLLFCHRSLGQWCEHIDQLTLLLLFARPYNSWDRLPFLTDVFNGSSTIVSAYNHLEANMFFSGSPFAIDTDDGSDRVNCTSNVIVSTPLFKTDFSGHTKTFQRNVDLYGACGGSEPGANIRLCPVKSTY